MNMKVKIKKMWEEAIIPTSGTNMSAGYDLYAATPNGENSISIMPHETVKIHTGLCIQPPEGYFGAIFARSGLATKDGIRPANCVGVCDNDYTGEYIIPLHNDSCDPVIIKKGDRVAQLIFLPYLDIEFDEVFACNKTERKDKGFGSTGR